ncbi:hypothetical protein GQR58_026159 [Nymphon striatum]|nr:hypothetical protein GQR58_026159 [Nymphon striatum]
MAQIQPFQFQPEYTTDEEGEESLFSSQSSSEDDRVFSDQVPSYIISYVQITKRKYYNDGGGTLLNNHYSLMHTSLGKIHSVPGHRYKFRLNQKSQTVNYTN